MSFENTLLLDSINITNYKAEVIKIILKTASAYTLNVAIVWITERVSYLSYLSCKQLYLHSSMFSDIYIYSILYIRYM